MGTLSTIEGLTKDGAASVLFYEIAGTSDLDNKCVVVNKVQPPLPSYFRAETFAKALDAAVEAMRGEK